MLKYFFCYQFSLLHYISTTVVALTNLTAVIRNQRCQFQSMFSFSLFGAGSTKLFCVIIIGSVLRYKFGRGSDSSDFNLIYLGREIWLSPVIQATWEARAVGWFEVEQSPQGFRWISGSALCPLTEWK
jgi:hypothetical protein